jgi:hypothetical protein
MQNVATITCRKPCRKKGVRYTDVTDDILNHQGERVKQGGLGASGTNKRHGALDVE